MEVKSRLRLLAILLLIAALTLVILILSLHYMSTRPPRAPEQHTTVSEDRTGICGKVVDLKPGRRFVDFGITEIHMVGLEAYFVTQPMDRDETPRELIIEKARVSLEDVECYLIVREHAAPPGK